MTSALSHRPSMIFENKKYFAICVRLLKLHRYCQAPPIYILRFKVFISGKCIQTRVRIMTAAEFRYPMTRYNLGSFQVL